MRTALAFAGVCTDLAVFVVVVVCVLTAPSLVGVICGPTDLSLVEEVGVDGIVVVTVVVSINLRREPVDGAIDALYGIA